MKKKLGKGFWESYDAFSKDYHKYQVQLSNAERKLAFAKDAGEVEKQYNTIRGIGACLTILSERIKAMVVAAENTLAKDFSQIEKER